MRNRWNMVPPGPVAAAVLGLTGCVVVDDIQESIVQTPTARVLDVAVTQQTDSGAALAATVEITNPNPVELPLMDVTVHFDIEGVGGFDAPEQPAVALPPSGTQRLRLTAAIPTRGDVSGKPYRFWATLTYQPPGELRSILSDSGVPRPFVTASADGTLESPR